MKLGGENGDKNNIRKRKNFSNNCFYCDGLIESFVPRSLEGIKVCLEMRMAWPEAMRGICYSVFILSSFLSVSEHKMPVK